MAVQVRSHAGNFRGGTLSFRGSIRHTRDFVVVDCFSWHARDSVFIPRSHPFSVGIPRSRRIWVIVRVVVVWSAVLTFCCLFDNSL